MKDRLLMYFKLQIKRDFRMLPSVLVMTLLLFAGASLLLSSFLATSESGEAQQKIRIGLVGNTDDSYMRMGIYALQNLDASRYAISIEVMDEEEAKQKLRKKEIAAYVLIPDGFVDGIKYGNNVPVQYVTEESITDIGAMMSQEYADAVAGELNESQNAIYSMEKYADENMPEVDKWELADQMVLDYVDALVDRTKLYDVKETGISNGMSFAGYYVCGGVVFFLMLWGISSAPLFQKRDRSLYEFLRSKNFHNWQEVLIEYAAYLLLMLICMFFSLCIAGIVLQYSGFTIPELTDQGLLMLLRYGVYAVPAAAMLAAMQFSIYEVTDSAVSSIMMQFLVAVVLGYVSGCFYPSSFFPQAMQTAGGILPSGIAMTYMKDLLMQRGTFWMILASAGYLIFFLLLSIRCRRQELE